MNALGIRNAADAEFLNDNPCLLYHGYLAEGESGDYREAGVGPQYVAEELELSGGRGEIADCLTLTHPTITFPPIQSNGTIRYCHRGTLNRNAERLFPSLEIGIERVEHLAAAPVAWYSTINCCG